MFRSNRVALIALFAFALCGKMEKITSASGSQPFTEEAVVRGIDYAVGPSAGQFGYGVAFVDLDNDLDADLVVIGRADGLVGVFENDGNGFFTDRSLGNGIHNTTSSSGVIAGDYDGDGDLDLYFSNWGTTDRLLRNDGGFQFFDITLTVGLGDPGNGQGCAWADYDNDGWLDLYLGNRTDLNLGSLPGRLYHNLGNGTFLDVAPVLGVDDAQPTFQSSFFDFDKDGDADLYLATDKGTNNCALNTNRLFENIGGSFVEITASSGSAGCVDSMCTTIGDFDGNRYQDLYVTSTPGGNALLLNQGDGTFTRDEVAAGVASFALGWGAVFFDWDNDGILDLYVCNLSEPNRLYSYSASFPATDLAVSLGVADTGSSFTTAVADIDDDGDLDLLLSNINDGIQLFINHEGENRNWIKFDLVGQDQNLFAVGATVELRIGATWQIREVIAGCNFKSQNELVLHFGLGNATLVDEMTIMWPGGDTRTLTNLATNRTWRIYPPERLGDSDANGIVNFADIDDFIAVLLGQDINSDHIALSDMNGDTLLDGRDIELFTQVLLP